MEFDNIDATLCQKYFMQKHEKRWHDNVESYHNGTLDFDKEKDYIINNGPVQLALTYDLTEDQLSTLINFTSWHTGLTYSIIDYKNLYNIRLSYRKRLVDKLGRFILAHEALIYHDEFNDYIFNKIIKFSDQDIYIYINNYKLTNKYQILLLGHIENFIIDKIANWQDDLYSFIDATSCNLSTRVLDALLDINNDIFYYMFEKNICYREMFPCELEQKFDDKMAPYFVLQQLKGYNL